MQLLVHKKRDRNLLSKGIKKFLGKKKEPKYEEFTR